ncbi:MAG: histidinol-phosphatase [Actinomycetes bacterium]
MTDRRADADLADPDLAEDLALALELADAADAITMARFRARDLAFSTKPDRTPVTEADHAVEEMVRAALARARPADGIVGEEFGVSGSGHRRWIVDPIDGTKSFLRGSPPWATLLALQVDGEIRLGVASAPALGRRWWATTGGGAFANGEPIAVSHVDHLSDALLCHADLLAYEASGCGPEFDALTRAVWDRRGFGDFWGHLLVAEGIADVMVEPVLEVWDIAALIPIVTEAGGRLTDRCGAVRADGGNAVTTNGVLHDAVMAIVADPVV